METLVFLYENAGLVAQLTWQHVQIVAVAVGAAILTGVPLGIAISQNERAARAVLYVAAVLMTIPSVALFGLMIPVLSLIGQGVGFLPTVIALFLYSQLPIIRNTYTAIQNFDPALREASRGMGMTTWERLSQVELPITVPIIMAGVRMAVVINIGIATVATYIGAGGLGKLISRGISQSDPRQLVAGAIMVSLLAIAADYFLARLQRRFTPAGMRDTSQALTSSRGAGRTFP
ncbi:ABC transporter permease [Achromobacter sp. NPDC058515]|uniref:ABC transporter permease n=1 Tax=Achromobacter sp. NPDC058515 TaxID=3346533 RepID=UPI00364DF617